MNFDNILVESRNSASILGKCFSLDSLSFNNSELEETIKKEHGNGKTVEDLYNLGKYYSSFLGYLQNFASTRYLTPIEEKLKIPFSKAKEKFLVNKNKEEVDPIIERIRKEIKEQKITVLNRSTESAHTDPYKLKTMVRDSSIQHEAGIYTSTKDPGQGKIMLDILNSSIKQVEGYIREIQKKGKVDSKTGKEMPVVEIQIGLKDDPDGLVNVRTTQDSLQNKLDELIRKKEAIEDLIASGKEMQRAHGLDSLKKETGIKPLFYRDINKLKTSQIPKYIEEILLYDSRRKEMEAKKIRPYPPDERNVIQKLLDQLKGKESDNKTDDFDFTKFNVDDKENRDKFLRWYSDKFLKSPEGKLFLKENPKILLASPVYDVSRIFNYVKEFYKAKGRLKNSNVKVISMFDNNITKQSELESLDSRQRNAFLAKYPGAENLPIDKINQLVRKFKESEYYREEEQDMNEIKMTLKENTIMSSLAYSGNNFVENYRGTKLVKMFAEDYKVWGDRTKDLYIALFGEEIKETVELLSSSPSFLNEAVNYSGYLLFEDSPNNASNPGWNFDKLSPQEQKKALKYFNQLKNIKKAQEYSIPSSKNLTAVERYVKTKDNFVPKETQDRYSGMAKEYGKPITPNPDTRTDDQRGVDSWLQYSPTASQIRDMKTSSASSSNPNEYRYRDTGKGLNFDPKVDSSLSYNPNATNYTNTPPPEKLSFFASLWNSIKGLGKNTLDWLKGTNGIGGISQAVKDNNWSALASVPLVQAGIVAGGAAAAFALLKKLFGNRAEKNKAAIMKELEKREAERKELENKKKVL